MASPLSQILTGATLVFGTSAFTAEITGVGHDGMARPMVETAHIGTAAAGAGKVGNMTKLPGDIVNPGALNIEFHYNPDTVPPIGAAPETVTLTLRSGATWVGTAFMTGYSYTGALDDKLTGTATIEWSGEITITAAV